jgi:hypothetical protein
MVVVVWPCPPARRGRWRRTKSIASVQPPHMDRGVPPRFLLRYDTRDARVYPPATRYHGVGSGNEMSGEGPWHAVERGTPGGGRAPNVACLAAEQQQSSSRTRSARRPVAAEPAVCTSGLHVAWPPAKSGVIAFAGVHAGDSAYVLPVLHVPEGSRASRPQGGQARFAAEAREWGMARDGGLSGALSWCS